LPSFFFNAPPTPQIYTLSLHDALPISGGGRILDDSSASPVIAPDGSVFFGAYTRYNYAQGHLMHFDAAGNYLGGYLFGWDVTPGDRKSTRLNSSHSQISYAVFCLKKKT